MYYSYCQRPSLSIDRWILPDGHMIPGDECGLNFLKFEQDSDHMCMWPGYHLLQAQILWCRERVDWRVVWCSLVLSDESRFCLYASDRHICVWRRSGKRHLLECIHPWHTGPTSGFMVWRAISYNSQPHLVFLEGKVNSAHYIAQVVNPVLLPYLRQEGDVLFSRSKHIYIWLLWCNMLFVVYNNCSGQQEP